MIAKKQVMAKLEEILDPEIGVNIVDLGLIYSVWVESDKIVHVKMTFTTPACPAGADIMEQVEAKLEELGFEKVDTLIVWDPPWGPEKMSEKAKAMLGMF